MPTNPLGRKLRYQASIAELVLKVQRLRSERQDAGCADKDTKSNMNAAKRARARVRHLLEEMYTWQSLGTVDPPAAFQLTEEAVRDLWNPGQPFPWGEATDQAQAKARAEAKHYGRLYHGVVTDLERSVEEKRKVKVERSRLDERLKYALQQMHAAKERHVAAGRGGAVFLLEERMNVVRGLLSKIAAWPAWR